MNNGIEKSAVEMSITEASATKERELPVPGASPIIPSAHPVSFKDQHRFEILVDSQEVDAMTLDIKSDVYTLPLDFGLLPALTRAGGRVLDLGAHIGTFALFAAKLGFEVAAVEASPRNAVLLQESAKRNHFDKLHLCNVAVSNRSETLDFIQGGPYGLVANPFLDLPTTSVQAMSVDEILATLGWEHVDFIKMDIEGSEVKAVAGMAKLLARDDAPPILYESNGHTLHYFGETPNSLMAALETFGYTCYLVEAGVEGGKLTPLSAGEMFFNCTVDCLAIKRLPDSLEGWEIGPPFSYEERIGHILDMAVFPHPHLRSFIARTLRRAEWRVLTDWRVLVTLSKLTRDPDPDVRADAAWFSLRGAPPGSERIAPLKLYYLRALLFAHRVWGKIKERSAKIKNPPSGK